MPIVSPQISKQGWEKEGWAGHRRKYHTRLSCQMLLHFANVSLLQKILFRNPLSQFEIRLGNMPIVPTYSQPKPKHSFLGSSSGQGRLLKYDEFCPEEGRLKVQKKKILKLKNCIQTAENNSLNG